MFSDRNSIDNTAKKIISYIGREYFGEFHYMSENITYFIYKNNEPVYTMRIARPKYRTYNQLKSEIDWLLLLSKTDIPVPVPIKINSRYINLVYGYYIIVFNYIDGKMPQYNDCSTMYECGKLAAKLHKSPKPKDIERPVWSPENMCGKNGLWGDWRSNKDLSGEDKEFIEEVYINTANKIKDYKTDKYGLIHTDLRMTNLLKGHKYYAIDFDDCGYGYYIQDLAGALSFMEDSNIIEDLKNAWYTGYEEILPLSQEDKDMADSFIILRRIQLLAWITSHYDSDYVKTVSDGFAEKTIEIIKNILRKG